MLLRERFPLTGKELREMSGIPRRTLYSSLRRLEDHGWLAARPSFKDTRQTYCWLNEPVTGPAPGPSFSFVPDAGPGVAA